MKTIPIYDATKPISCTIANAEIPGRIDLVERMRANLLAIERSEHGMLLRFPNRPDTEADLHRFAVDEKRCCEFWGFDIQEHGDDVILRWDAPPAASGLVDQLLGYFRGEQPLTAISGLL